MAFLPSEIVATNWLTLLLGSVLGYSVLVSGYRLFLHPLSSFPGPKLAAITSFYQLYYDVYKQGEFLNHLRELHDIYGVLESVCYYMLLTDHHQGPLFDADQISYVVLPLKRTTTADSDLHAKLGSL